MHIPGTREVTYQPTQCDIGTELKWDMGYNASRGVNCPNGGEQCLMKQLRLGAIAVPGTTETVYCASLEIVGDHEVMARSAMPTIEPPMGPYPEQC